ncbi:MAG: thioredoxin-disulfide reductase [Verrucomicrobiota bacterium]
MENVLILGSGPAGLTAAIYCARANLEPLVVHGASIGGQLVTTTEVENFPGFPEGIGGAELMERFRNQADRFGCRFKTGDAVSAEYGRQPLRTFLSGGEAIESRAVILATGSSPRYLGLPSEQKLIGRGVSTCATCDGAFYRDSDVAIVGGGDTAMEEALFLSRLCSKVTVIHRRGELRASKIMASRAQANSKINFLWNSVVKEVLDVGKNEVTGVKIRNVKTGEESYLGISGLFIAIGHEPNTAAFKGQVAMEEAGYIVTENTRTSAEGVYAAGDVQDYQYRQAITASGSGCQAALEVERYLSRL